ncbi:MAG: DUF1553 domain-containing protein [Armatimonadota bacterium]
MAISLRAAVAATTLLAAGGVLAQTRPAAPPPAAAAKSVLEARCVKCHNARSASGGLDLTTDAARRRRAATAVAVVPGNSGRSELIRRLEAEGSKPSMPLGEKPLSAAEKTALAAWIDAGGRLAGTLGARVHWAWEAPRRPAVPTVPGDTWSRTPIDRFLMKRMRAEGLRPNPDADRVTLIRRVTLDLIGLPPTPEEIDAFLADTRPGAYERVVDRLLASPHYGERMVLPWLDAARYADSNGFQQDGDTYQYVWRDQVVRALNANQPFDQFTIEQLAGDLLPGATLDQQVASAFNRNHMLNGEGGAIPEEQRNVLLFDRVNTTATTWLGVSLACAQCHDHKYDPFTQRDYYRFLAFFNRVPESGVPPGGGQYRIADPAIAAGTADEMAAIAKIERDRDEAKRVLASTVNAKLSSQRKSLAAALIADPRVTVAAGPWTISEVRGAADFNAAFETAWTETIAFSPFETAPDGTASVEIPAISQRNNSSVLIQRTLVASTDTAAELRFGSDDGIKVWIDGHLVVRNAVNRAALLGQESARWLLKAGTTHTVRIQITNGGGTAGYAFELRQAPRSTTEDQALRAIASGGESSGADALLGAFVDGPDLDPLRARVRDAENRISMAKTALPRVMVMSDAQARTTRILARGDYLQPRDPVTPGAPGLLGGNALENRLELARWLVRSDHPLVARVQVNRYWQLFFGTGLFKTTENLGTLGEPPSHPELLDWLATEFAWDWDVKRIHRLIVSSSAYRQSSTVRPEVLKADPANRLLARSPRMRLPSPLLRDLALSASGLLDKRIGGKPVYPYQPAGIWDGLAITKERDFTYPQSTGNDLWRRSLYTFWRRTAAPGNLFDTAARQQCTVNQSRTSTPLHALTTLNDVTWTEASRVLAARSLSETTNPREAIGRMTRRVLGRRPAAAESDALLRIYAKALAHYARTPADTDALLRAGAAPAPTTNRAETAAMAQVALALLNLDEAITRE